VSSLLWCMSCLKCREECLCTLVSHLFSCDCASTNGKHSCFINQSCCVTNDNRTQTQTERSALEGSVVPIIIISFDLWALAFLVINFTNASCHLPTAKRWTGTEYIKWYEIEFQVWTLHLWSSSPVP